MEEIPLGSLNSKIYEKNGKSYYKISPIFGMQINFYLDAPISDIKVLKNSGDELIIKNGILKLKMQFSNLVPGLNKLRLKPYYFGLPFGIYWCEISTKNKRRLKDVFQVHS